jgi:hypothetical protein
MKNMHNEKFDKPLIDVMGLDFDIALKRQVEDYERAETKIIFDDLLNGLNVPIQLFDSNKSHHISEIRFLNYLYGNDKRTTKPAKRNYSEGNTNAGNGKAVYAVPSKNIQSEGFEVKKGDDNNFES